MLIIINVLWIVDPWIASYHGIRELKISIVENSKYFVFRLCLANNWHFRAFNLISWLIFELNLNVISFIWWDPIHRVRFVRYWTQLGIQITKTRQRHSIELINGETWRSGNCYKVPFHLLLSIFRLTLQGSRAYVNWLHGNGGKEEKKTMLRT